MTWLLAHMWIVVAATTLVAVLLGWSIRGMMLSGKMRKAVVERDMARVELGNAREEVEKLFAQIKKLSNGEAPAPAAPDPILARKVESLTAELARKSAEIEALKTAAPLAAVAMRPADAAAAAPPEESLAWRNRHLESRVVHLEAELAKAGAQAAPAAAPVAAHEPDAGHAKLDWEVKYLRTRVEALQAELAAVPVAAASESAPVPAAVAPAEDQAAPVEEEISRLRWRVRFLEGRLAYFEGDAQSAEAVEGVSVESEAPRSKSVSEAILGQLEAADERAEAEEAQQVARVRPSELEKPDGGKADDLTLIGGIGPKIQDVLNSLGIFHFRQIAGWTPENIAWVDEYLSFSGRITREGWIEQAAILVSESAEA